MRSDATQRVRKASLESGGGRILEPLMDREQRRDGGGQAEEHAAEHDAPSGDGGGPGTAATTTTQRSTTNTVEMSVVSHKPTVVNVLASCGSSTDDEETCAAIGEAMRVEVRIAHQRQQHRWHADECVRRDDDD